MHRSTSRSGRLAALALLLLTATACGTVPRTEPMQPAPVSSGG